MPESLDNWMGRDFQAVPINLKLAEFLEVLTDDNLSLGFGIDRILDARYSFYLEY